MSSKFWCDRCGDEIKDRACPVRTDGEFFVSISEPGRYGTPWAEHVDVCKKCLLDIALNGSNVDRLDRFEEMEQIRHDLSRSG